MSLDELGLKYGTDKASNGHDYLRVYEQYLLPMRAEPVALLEVGWWEGDSMRMWREYFTRATIVGIDIEPKADIPGVYFRQGNQTDKKRLDAISLEFGPWDVIVDDASHVASATVATFEHLWPSLRPGGLYFVEDLQVAYHKNWGGDPHPRHVGGTAMNLLKGIADEVHHGHGTVQQVPSPEFDVQHVAFWPGLAVVQKREEQA